MATRRRLLQGAFAGMAVLVSAAMPATVLASQRERLLERFVRIERDTGGRLGVALLDASGAVICSYRGDERFPMCSTIKFLLVAAVLQQHDQGRVDLQRRIPIRASDLLQHSPVCAQSVGEYGLSVAELCQAAIIWSDNAAANLLFALLGGPGALSGFIRGIGDQISRSDRIEPELNHYAPDDPRDTTSTQAMAANLRSLLLGDVLTARSRQRLRDWLIDNRTGDTRLRAGLPAGWKIGDKTGSNGRDTVNDIAIIWPPGGSSPLLLAVYLNAATVDTATQDDALKQVAAAVATTMTQ